MKINLKRKTKIKCKGFAIPYFKTYYYTYTVKTEGLIGINIDK